MSTAVGTGILIGMMILSLIGLTCTCFNRRRVSAAETIYWIAAIAMIGVAICVIVIWG